MTLRKYQILVVVSLLLYGFWMLLPYTGWTVTAETFRAFEYAGAGALDFTVHPLFYLVLFTVRAAATLGMFLVLTWGRNLFVAWLLVGVALGPVSGVMVTPAIDSGIGYFSALLDGAIAALSYSSPIGRLFRIDGQAQSGALVDGRDSAPPHQGRD